MTFNPNDHNRIGSQKEVERCSLCIYNEHDIIRGVGGPHLVCEHPEIMAKNDMKPRLIAIAFKYENCELVETKEFREQLEGFPSFCPLER